MVKCIKCGKSFSSVEDLDKHARSKHGVACSDCLEEDDSSKFRYSLRSIVAEILQVFSNPEKPQAVEREMLKLSLMSFVSLLVLAGIGYWGFFSGVPKFLDRFGLLFFYLILGIVANSSVVWHTRAYRNVSCQTGMMIGMVTGMFSGFTVGMILGVSNGMFVGSVAGALVGMLVGSWSGKCSGIMGTLEGLMAGFMAGPMGAMTSIMMFSDNYLLYIPFALFFSVIALAGLAFMVYKENAGQELGIAKQTARQDFFVFLGANFFILLALGWLMLFGPKSALFSISILG